MIKLSQTINNIQPSMTLAAAARAAELKAQGRDIISLTVGEPDFDTPEHIKNAAIEALKKGFTKYTPTSGIPVLKKAICEKFKRDQNLDYTPQEVIVTNGGKHALAAACAVLLNPGDEVIIPAPYWTSYPDMVLLAGGKPIIVNTLPEDGYLLTAEGLLKACSPRTKMIILNSPSNPTGGCYSAGQFQELGKAILSLKNYQEIVVISDEVYEYITFDNFQHVSFAAAVPELKSTILTVNAFSKSYSMTGWRVGYAVGPKEVISAMDKHQSQVTSNVCSISQYAAAQAYTDNAEFPKKMKVEFAKRLEMICQYLPKMKGLALAKKPLGSFFVFLRIEGLFGKKDGNLEISSAADFSKYLLEKYNIAVVQGEAFGDPGAIRLSFALSEQQLKIALERIIEATHALN